MLHTLIAKCFDHVARRHVRIFARFHAQPLEAQVCHSALDVGLPHQGVPAFLVHVLGAHGGPLLHPILGFREGRQQNDLQDLGLHEHGPPGFSCVSEDVRTQHFMKCLRHCVLEGEHMPGHHPAVPVDLRHRSNHLPGLQGVARVQVLGNPQDEALEHGQMAGHVVCIPKELQPIALASGDLVQIRLQGLDKALRLAAFLQQSLHGAIQPRPRALHVYEAT
mmetsp:Transcript_105106/g.250215  ORF Transcript_105106/g.250215 Transcript_105106/m.250215 type:complete len:221 (-) Transcript_105106:1593-2255(-)